MSAFSDYLETALLNLIFQGTSFSTLSNVYVSLHTASPADDASGTEVSGGSYARVAVSTSGGWTVTYTNGTAKATDNVGAVTFPAATSSWGTITHFGLWDASSGGNLLFHAALAFTEVVSSGDTPRFLANQLIVNLD